MTVVNLIHQRMYHDSVHTMGYIIFGGKINYILEDTKRDVKIKGVTRIPAGKYRLKFREVLSGKTKKYRELYDWFKWHIELQEVEGFKYVYDHIGNYAENTDGCRLHGMQPANPREVQRPMVINSRVAFKSYYEYVSKLLNSGAEVYTTIYDEIYENNSDNELA